jgi:hypothetical protein
MRSAQLFLHDETGAVTIEFVTLVPAFILLLVLFTDASIVYLSRTEMWNTARDVVRRMSTDQITTHQEALNYAATHLFLGYRQYTVTTDFGAEMDVTITVPLVDAAVFGIWFKPLIGETLSVSARMRREPLL